VSARERRRALKIHPHDKVLEEELTLGPETFYIDRQEAWGEATEI
jgi:hypothetical protein